MELSHPFHAPAVYLRINRSMRSWVRYRVSLDVVEKRRKLTLAWVRTPAYPSVFIQHKQPETYTAKKKLRGL
jgi:hypothetical protein